jgi:hypothetical protein
LRSCRTPAPTPSHTPRSMSKQWCTWLLGHSVWFRTARAI